MASPPSDAGTHRVALVGAAVLGGISLVAVVCFLAAALLGAFSGLVSVPVPVGTLLLRIRESPAEALLGGSVVLMVSGPMLALSTMVIVGRNERPGLVVFAIGTVLVALAGALLAGV